MERIRGQKRGFRQLAEKVLYWIVCAKRPLATSELQTALAVEVGDLELNKEKVKPASLMVSVCAGLVIVDEESGIVRLVHYTTHEYFKQTQADWFPTAEKDITIICATYLTFDEFGSGPSPTDDDFEERLRRHQLYEYAACNWGHHALEAQLVHQEIEISYNRDFTSEYEELEVKDENAILVVMKFLGIVGNSEAAIQALFKVKIKPDYPGFGRSSARMMTALHLAAYFGLQAVVKLLLAHDQVGPDTKDTSYGRTPLSWAAGNGHEAVVKLLLAHDQVGPDTKDNDGQIPLTWAAGNGHEAVVKLLLAHDQVRPDTKDSYGQVPLSWAARGGHEAVVKLLLANDQVRPETKDTDGRTPLSWAAERGHEAVVKLLLANDQVGPDTKDNTWGRTPLSWAAICGHEAVVKLLLANDQVRPETKDTDGRTPLSWAAERGHEAVVKLLLANDQVGPDTKDTCGQTPLSRAAKRGHEAVVRLLPANDKVNIDNRDNHGLTAIQLAYHSGQFVVEQYLNKQGAYSDDFFGFKKLFMVE
jgi:ankyrin repeat protein